MTLRGPQYAVGGTQIREGKALAIASGSLLINNKRIPEVKTRHDATKIDFKINLKKGPAKIQAWLNDEEGLPLCGAYYVRIKRLNE